MSDVVAEISTANNDANGDVTLPADATNNTSDSLLISSSPVTLAASSIPVSSTASNILIPPETGLPSSETATVLDVIPADESEGNAVASNGTQGEAQNDASVAIVASDSSFILDSSQAIELNGEKHEIVQQIQDPDSGDILVVLKSESGKHVALPLSTFTEGLDMASHDVGENESVLPQANSDTATTNLDPAIVYQAANDESCVLNVQSDKMQSNTETFNANAQKEDTSSAAPVIPVSSSEVGANSESLQSFVPATSVASTDGSESYVIMSSTDGSTEQVNLAEVIGRPDAPGQTYLIETADGLVACSSASSDAEKNMTDAVSNVAPILATSDLSTATTTEYVENDLTTSTEEAILQAVTSSGNIVDGQIIHAVAGSQTVAYQIAATENGIQLIPLGSVASETPSSTETKKPTPNTRARTSSNNSNTLLSDQPYTARRSKQSVGKNSKTSNVAETRTPEYKMHSSSYTKSTSKSSASLFTPTNSSSSSLIGDSLGPSQLASSHRTYSRKNIVWVNPETNQSASTSSSSASSTTQATSTATTATPTTTKTVSFAPKPTNSSIELTSPVSQKTSSPAASIVASAAINTSKKPDAEVVHKKVSPVVKADKEPSSVTPSKVVKTPVSTRRSAVVKSPERAKQALPPPPPPPPQTVVAAEKPEKQNSTKESDSQANNHVITVEVVSQEESVSRSPSKECPKEAVEESQQVDETPTSAKRRRGRPSKRSLEEPAGKTDVENTLSGSSKRSKTVEATKSEPVEQSSGRESRRTRRTPKRYTSDDDNSSEAEKGDKNSSDATETNKQISISSATEHKANSNCETIQDSIQRLSPPKVNIAVTNDTSESSVIGNDAVAEDAPTLVEPNESNSNANLNSVTEEGQVSTTNCELTLDSSNLATECEVNETTPSKTGSNRPARKAKKQVGFKDLTQESSESSEAESVTTAATTLSTRKRVQITTDVNGSEESASPRAKKSPSVTSDLKLTPILKTTSKYSPVAKGKRLDPAVVCYFSPTDQEVIQMRLRESISTLSDTRSPAEKYDLISTDCSIHVRVQPSALLYKRGSDSTYICQKCGYTTSRLNNLIFHHKDQCSVVQHAVRQLWAHEIRMQTKSNLNTSTLASATSTSYLPNQNSPLSSSSLLADVSSSNFHHETDESNQLSDLGI